MNIELTMSKHAHMAPAEPVMRRPLRKTRAPIWVSMLRFSFRNS